MNYHFKTGFERIAVLEDLRRPQIIFPMDFVRHRQRESKFAFPSVYAVANFNSHQIPPPTRPNAPPHGPRALAESSATPWY